ncbi:MAG: head-tail adaptor protein [Pseudomonadota bacterium]
MKPVLSRRLTLESPSRLPDGSGGFFTSWINLGYLWAEIDPLGGGLDARPEGTSSVFRSRITVRAAPVGSSRRPVAGQRLVDGSRGFEIDAVTEAEHPLYLWVYAREVRLT